jgi:hypothetical protein
MCCKKFVCMLGDGEKGKRASGEKSIFMQGLVDRLGWLVTDSRIGPVHVSFYVALWWCGQEADASGGPWRGMAPTQFGIRKEVVMKRAKIQGSTTYYKTLKELDQWGFIEYVGLKKRFGGSKVVLKPHVSSRANFD